MSAAAIAVFLVTTFAIPTFAPTAPSGIATHAVRYRGGDVFYVPYLISFAQMAALSVAFSYFLPRLLVDLREARGLSLYEALRSGPKLLIAYMVGTCIALLAAMLSDHLLDSIEIVAWWTAAYIVVVLLLRRVSRDRDPKLRAPRAPNSRPEAVHKGSRD